MRVKTIKTLFSILCTCVPHQVKLSMREAISFMEATKLFSARQVKSWRPAAPRCNFFGVKCTEFSEACNPHSTSYEKSEII